MTNSNNDIEELEELLTELEGQEARLVRPYAEDDDAVTQLMDAPLGDQEWMVQVTALDRRMMSMPQLLSELQSGKLSNRTLVWRGGMDDWSPIAHIDELSQLAARPMGSSPRMALGTMQPAPLSPPPSQPVWSSAAGSGLPAPPVALPPATMLAPPPPSAPMGLSRPMAAPLPPPPVSLPPQSSNTTRPVAVDFSDITPEPPAGMQGKRAVMALSAMAILAVFVTVYAVSSGGNGTADGSAKAEAQAAAQPQAVGALQPAGAEKNAEPATADKAPEPNPEPAAAKSSDQGTAEEAAGDESTTRQANAPARYSPRSEYRRRSKSTADDAPSSDEKPAAAVSPPPRAPKAEAEDDSSEEVASAPADDDADSDEAPKSTGKGASTFNRDAAKQALDEAASQAKNCRPQGGPSGTGRVQVRYEPSGKVAAVAILTSKFENTTTGSCVRMLFRRAKVPEFTGAPVVVVNKSFEIP
jgi:hypothetical protein